MRPLKLIIAATGLCLILAGIAAAKGNYVHAAGEMEMPRAAHTATLIHPQFVLIAGGMQADGVSTADTVIYDAGRAIFRAGPTMTVARAGHTATLLNDQRILILGGFSNRKAVATAELYEPSTRAFVGIGDAPVSGGGFTATLLDDGRVLIIGGDGGSSTYLFDPETNTFADAASLILARTGHTAIWLDDGRVLIVGGTDLTGRVTASAELYDPLTDTFTQTGELHEARHKHAAVKLLDGTVLVMGGATEEDWTTRMAGIERYDPAAGTFSPAGSLLAPRFKFADAVTLLDDGTVLVAGGGAPEIYDPETGACAQLPGDRLQTLHYATATKIRNGPVFIVGGYTKDIRVSDQSWLYVPPHGT